MTLKINDIANAILDVFPFVFTQDNGKIYVGGKEFFVKKDGVIPVKKGQHIVIGCTRKTQGIYPGCGDMIGWTEKIVTAEMVGQQIAVFTSIEIKTAKDILSKKQRTWNKVVAASGGIAETWKDVKGEIKRMKGSDIE